MAKRKSRNIVPDLDRSQRCYTPDGRWVRLDDLPDDALVTGYVGQLGRWERETTITAGQLRHLSAIAKRVKPRDMFGRRE